MSLFEAAISKRVKITTKFKLQFVGFIKAFKTIFCKIHFYFENFDIQTYAPQF